MRMKFQSTFPRGERRPVLVCLQYSVDFNPRSRVGNDAPYLFASNTLLISIHVPAWGTTNGNLFLSQIIRFQSTFPRGERPLPVISSSTMFTFQSTFPRGERQHRRYHTARRFQFQSTFPRGERPFPGITGSTTSRDFNPRSRVGND